MVWQPGVDPQQVAGLASTRTYPLRSSFRPGYNMAVNLVGRLGVDAARELLEQSFGQFQADRSVVGLARRIERNAEALAGYAESMRCHLGDFAEYAALRRRVAEREKALRRQGMAQQPRRGRRTSLRALRPGDVIAVPGGRRAGLAVVLDPGRGPDGDDPRPLVLTEDRWAGRLSSADFPTPVDRAGPDAAAASSVDHRAPRVRRDLASSLRNTGIVAPTSPRRGRSGKGAPDDDPELATLRRALRAHPCHGCDDREAHARWAERHARLERETEQLRQKVRATTHSLAAAFDRIRALLGERGYLSRDGEGETVTAHGERLARLWGESDLLAAECLRHGVWDGLEPAELAAVVSALVYESRRDLGPVPRVPAGARVRGAGRDRAAVGRAGGRRAPPPGRPHPRAGPRVRLADAPVGAGRVAVGRAHRGRAERRRAVGGRLRPLVPPGARPARPDRAGRRARHAGRAGGGGGGDGRSGAGWWRPAPPSPFTAVSRPDRLRRAARVCLDRAGSADEEGVAMTRPYEPEPYGRRPPDPAPDPTAGWGRPPAGGWGGPEPAAGGGAVPGPYGDEPQYGWQPQYEPTWGQDYPTKPRKSAQQRGRQRLLVAVVAALVVVVVLVLGFVTPGWFVTRVFDAAAVQTGVAKILTDDYATDGVADVRCPQNVQVTAGATFSCDATIDGDPVTVPITVTDDRGGYQVGRPA